MVKAGPYPRSAMPSRPESRPYLISVSSAVKIKQFQVDAFASKVFEGNPAAVCPLDDWLDDGLLQAIAEENNLSETAFFVPTDRGFHLRWFTPVAEVDLCGHATLAAAHVLFGALAYPERAIRFETRSGDLTVQKRGDFLEMDFPSRLPNPCTTPDGLLEGLGRRPLEVLAADDYVAVYETEADILAIAPDLEKLKRLDLRGVAITAPGRDVDFVSRFFGPKFGIPEDPVTGSAHCELAPYWQRRLGKDSFEAKQLSRRGGSICCEVKGDRVVIGGRAVIFMEAEIAI